MKFKAVAWDIDGTLVDSEPLHHQALLAASLGFGCDLSDLPDQAFRGVHMHDVWHILRPRLPKSLDELSWLQAIDAHYVANTQHLRPITDAVAMVKQLAALEMPQACVSNSGRAVVDANLAALGIRDAIAFSISLDDVKNGKPDPEPYLTACTRLGLDPASVVAIEDSRSGALSARRAGLTIIGYAATGGGFDDVDYVIPDFSDFMMLLT
ncbi:MAG TPA: HAD family phosphatase [Terriglobia bacterium]|nr:HAD family phosphatase [Terriglobia bacterium]